MYEISSAGKLYKIFRSIWIVSECRWTCTWIYLYSDETKVM